MLWDALCSQTIYRRSEENSGRKIQCEFDLSLQHCTYLIVDLACLSVPFAASFYPKHAFYKEWKHFIPANLLVAALFLIWDVAFTRAGIWGFNSDYLTGLYLANLPVEEWFFFFCIPYACVFTWFAFEFIIRNNPLIRIERRLTLVLAIGLIGGGLLFYQKWYTAVTFLATGLFLLYKYVRSDSLAGVYLSFLTIFPFFLLSNSLLTGSWIESPIVWYNNEENLGLRLGTIPVEDTVYGFLLIALNIEFYQMLKRKSGIKADRLL